jgi:hypothetical protein
MKAGTPLPLVIMAIALVAGAGGYAVGLGSGDDLEAAPSGGSAAAPAPTVGAAEPRPREPVTLGLERPSKMTTDSVVRVEGTVTEGAQVTVNGKRAKIKGEHFSRTLPLELGKNRVQVVATRPDLEQAREVARIIREEVPVGVETAPTPPAEAAPSPGAEETVPSQSEDLEYSEELPHGRPGYLLPEGERSLGCVGYDAQTGECVGD